MKRSRGEILFITLLLCSSPYFDNEIKFEKHTATSLDLERALYKDLVSSVWNQ